MSSTTTDIALTPLAIKALRQADDVYAHFTQDDGYFLAAYKRATYEQRQSDPYVDDKRFTVPCEGSIAVYDRDTSSDNAHVVACFANVWHSEGIWQIVRPGDRLRLRWSRGGHSSENTRAVGYVGDTLTIEVLRKNDEHGRKPLAFLAATYVGPDNSARLCRTHN